MMCLHGGQAFLFSFSSDTKLDTFLPLYLKETESIHTHPYYSHVSDSHAYQKMCAYLEALHDVRSKHLAPVIRQARSEVCQRVLFPLRVCRRYINVAGLHGSFALRRQENVDVVLTGMRSGLLGTRCCFFVERSKIVCGFINLIR